MGGAAHPNRQSPTPKPWTAISEQDRLDFNKAAVAFNERTKGMTPPRVDPLKERASDI